MAFRIGEYVARGEIDNRAQNTVAGTIWLADVEEPLHLALEGNCLRDLAGMHFVFECTAAKPAPEDHLPFPDQVGQVGDMTASRKVRILDMSVEEAYPRLKQGLPVPEHMGNCLYLEWFSERNGRVVIETTDFRVVSISEPAWRMTSAEEDAQRGRNAEAIVEFMNRIAPAVDPDSPSDADSDAPMDEFEWERFLRESDRRTEKYGELLEKYKDHPDSERIVAREMGWDHIEDMLDADARGAFDEARTKAEEDDADFDADDPDDELPPETEGIDWIRTPDGDVRHPLAHRASEAGVRLIDEYRARGWMPNQPEGEADRDTDLADLMFNLHMVGAKLAGALGGVARDFPPDPGFIVAYLKRALPYFDKAHAALGRVLERRLGSSAFFEGLRAEMFEIRGGILELMKKYRGQIGS